MMQERTDAELDSLLERGGLGPSRREAILSEVLARVQAERPERPRRRWLLAAFGTAAAAAVVLLIGPWRSPQESSLREKGAAVKPSSTKVSAELDCLGATLGACPKGSLIVVHAAGVQGFVSAWAEPVNGGERIWYFSGETFSPRLDALGTSAATTRAVKLGSEHTPGSYVVHLRITAQPMARDQLLRLPSKAALVETESLLTVASP